MENAKFCSRGIRNNNPANIKISHYTWLGQKSRKESSDKTFCQFYNIDFGIRALIILLRNYLIKGFDTPTSIITRFAPPSENYTQNYIDFVLTYFISSNYDNFSSALSPYEIIRYNTYQFFLICAAICEYESGYKLTLSHYKQIIKQFQLNT